MDTNYLITQISKITGQLHGLFDEIGVSSHERESKEIELFTALSETLHNQLRLVAAEKNELTEEANRMIKNIRQMKASLEDRSARDTYDLDDKELKVTIPLTRCLQTLKEKHNAVAKLHRERSEQVKRLAQALESYSSHLEPSYVTVALPPTSNNASVSPSFDLSPLYIASLDNEFTRVYEEYSRRINIVKIQAEEIVNLWAELGTPQAQTESSIVKYYREAPEQLGLHEDDIKRLQAKRDRLLEEKRGRERRLKELKVAVEGLWDRLSVEEPDRRRFLASSRGCGLRAINEFEAELDRLNGLKRQNLHLFVDEARYKLQELWDGLYFSEEEMLDFAPAFSDVYSDALLSAHEAEIARLEVLKEQRAPTLQLIETHQALIKDRDDLAAASMDASRLLMKPNKGEKRDPTRLLREEKMRKKIAKDLPKIEAQLRRALERQEDDYGRPFLVRGTPYLEELAAAAAAAAANSLPPRAKTPSAGPGYATMTKHVPLKSAPPPSTSRAGSVASSVIRGHSGSRPGITTPAMGTLRQNPMASSISTAGGRTPSKIPARVPLGTMRHGGNSPERRAPTASESAAAASSSSLSSYGTNTMRQMGPPAKAPPPKMRSLIEPPKIADRYNDENVRCVSAASSHGSGSVRQISPEDVYDDRERMSYVNTSMMPPPLQQNRPQNYREVQAAAHRSDNNHHHQQYVPAADSRQISTTSTSTTVASGSENWETFDDASEPEAEAGEEQHYYAGVRAGKTSKRVMPDGGYTPPLRGSPGKKFKGMYGIAGHAQAAGVEEGRKDQGGGGGGGGSHRMVTGSDSGWTDEDGF